MIDPALLSILVKQLAVVIALALIGAAVAERLGSFRWLGGLAAGLLLSGALLGNLAPAAHQWLITGGYHEQRSLAQARAETRAELETYMRQLAETGVSAGHVQTQRQLKQAERRATLQPLQAAVQQAQARHAKAIAGWTWAVILLAAFACGAGARLRQWRTSFADAAPMAIAAAVTAILLVLLLTRLIGGLDARGDVLLAAAALMTAVLCGGTPLHPNLTRLTRQSPATVNDDAAQLTQATPWLLAMIALVGLAMLPVAGLESTTMSVGGTESPTLRLRAGAGALLLLPLAAIAHFLIPHLTLRAVAAVGLVATGWFAAAIHPLVLAFAAGLTLRPRRGHAKDDPPATGDPAIWWVSPIIACAAALRINPSNADLSDVMIWGLLLAIVVGDGRALGAAFAGRTIGGRSTAHALRFAIAASVPGPLPLALTLALHIGGVLDHAMLAALLIAYALTALLAPLTLRLARTLWPDDEPPDPKPMQ
jgi:hypothetical protein